MKVKHSNIVDLRHSYEEFINEWNNDLEYIEIQTSGLQSKNDSSSKKCSLLQKKHFNILI